MVATAEVAEAVVARAAAAATAALVVETEVTAAAAGDSSLREGRSPYNRIGRKRTPDQSAPNLCKTARTCREPTPRSIHD